MSNNEYVLAVGPKIRAIRDLKQVKQDVIADILKVNQSTISRIESGESMISFELLCQIADALEVDVNAIINLDSSVVFNSYNCHQAGMHNHYNQSGLDQIKALYERLLEEKDKRIDKLEKLVEGNA